MPAEKPSAPRPSDSRRSNKPVMEKRRRARINQCLNELKSLILEALRKDPARHSKLEKADILEMTVKHLQNVQRHQMAIAMASDPTVLSKFRSGFNECAAEVTRYVNRIEGVETGIRQRLVSHLANCVSGLSGVAPLTALGGGIMTTAALATALSVPTFPLSNNSNNNTARLLSGLSLIPGRLLGGDIALLLSNQTGFPIFSPSLPTPTTPSATVTKDSTVDKMSAFTAVNRPITGALSPVSVASSCTSGSSTFSPTLRDSSSPDGQSSFLSSKSAVTEPSTSSLSNSDSSTTPSSSTAESERMWRPW